MGCWPLSAAPHTRPWMRDNLKERLILHVYRHGRLGNKQQQKSGCTLIGEGGGLGGGRLCSWQHRQQSRREQSSGGGVLWLTGEGVGV